MENLFEKETSQSPCTSQSEQEETEERIFDGRISGDVAETKIECSPLDVEQRLWSEVIRWRSEQTISFDEDHNLVVSGTVAVNNRDGSHREHTESVTWIRWRPTQVDHSLNIRFSSPRVVQKFRHDVLAPFMSGNHIDAEVVSDCFPGNDYTKSLDLWGSLAGLLRYNTSQCDNSSLYAKGFIMMLEAEAYRRAGIEPGLIPLPENNSLVIRSTFPAKDDVNSVFSEFYDDVLSRAFVIPGLYFTSQKQLNILQILACPYPRFTNASVTEATNAELTGAPFCFTEISFIPEIAIRLYCHPPIPDSPQLTAPDPQDILLLLRSLANIRAEQDQLVVGLTRAVTWWNGIDANYGVSDGAKIAVMNSLLEMGTVYWPVPRDCNWMWRAYKFVPCNPQFNQFFEEYSACTSLSPTDIDRYGGVVAAIISCGKSSVLNMFNLTGRQVTRFACGLEGSELASRFLEQILQPITKEIAPIYPLLCGIISKCSNIKVSPLCWSRTKCSFVKPAGVTEDDLWGRRWPKAVPYIVDPMSVNWLLNRWLDVWGFVAPKERYVSIELKRELIMHSSKYAQWRADRFPGYDSVAQSNTPYLFVPYGLCMFNILSQVLNRKDPWPVTFLCYPEGAPRGTVDFNELTADLQPQMIPAISTVRPGTFLSYSWENRQVIAPSVKKDDFAEEDWRLLVSGGGVARFDNCGVKSGGKGGIGDEYNDLFDQLDQLFLKS